MAGQPEKRSTLGHLLNVSMPFQTLMNSSLSVMMLKLLS